ncbi:hypothetical protein DERP_007234 [Dermatophagoides pteronyssinus]|uniref:Uncharacterized protein n=1 Tax=Dermatophagoides pteronyssinus TaxID=6956 RepID=A0ABQ8J429_DERPT|nr:hypothetical protein DERP_007234 [Dermatophagoides pteronyssinus]
MMIVDAVPIVNNNTDAFESQCSKVNINHPCRCETSTTTTTTTNVNKIQCDGEYEFNLNGQFKHRLSGNSQDDDLIIFDEFILNNTEISRLDDNLFGQRIRFKRIKLVDCLSLRHISSNTFQQSGPFIQEFIVQGESSLGEDQYASDLFDSMNSMINVEKIWLNRNRLRSIPTVAFGKQTGDGQGDRFARLKELNFNKFSSKNGHIKSVGNFAFYYLNQLQYLYLSHQRINYLPANSFDFEKSSNQTLYIYLGNNKLNNTSFERGIFLNSKRPIHLELYWNPDLTYLDEQIFRPFLEQNPLNRISLQDNPLQCDCQSYWLYKDRQKFSNQLQNIMCKIGPRQTFNIDLISFDKCHQNNNGRKRNKLIVVN